MPKIIRQAQKIFGDAGATGNFGKFGSRAAGSPVNTKNIETIQDLDAWDNGWQEAVLGSNAAPFLEDMNSAFFVFAYQISYLLQEGIAEFNLDTEYFIGSIVKDPGTGDLYRSKIDDNLGNPIPSQADNTEWAWQNPSGSGSGFDADTVDTIHASAAPEPNKLLALDANSQFPPSVVSGFGNGLKSNLVVTTNAGTPDTQVDIDADLLSVEGVILLAVNLTADIAVSGANGLDVGAEASNTWYAVHVITNDNGSSVASLLSLSSGAPTLPVGFTKFRRVGWVRNDASGDFVPFTKIMDKVLYNDPNALLTLNPTGVISLAQFIPPTSRFANLNCTSFISLGAAPGTGITVSVGFRTDSASSFIILVFSSVIDTEHGAQLADANTFDFRLTASRTVEVNDIGGPGTRTTNLFVMGYTDSSSA